MPDSSALWMAASLLWILDASINISMEPFRAFVGDNLNEDQRTTGFITQSFFIGVGATLANALPIILRYMGVTGTTASGIPLTVYYSFKAGAAVFLLAVLYTVFTSKEYPPENPEEFIRLKAERGGFGKFIAEIIDALKEMPATMKQLAVVQFFTWLGLFCMWMFYGLATAYHVFGAATSKAEKFDRGTEWGGWMFAIYSIVCFIVAFALPVASRTLGRKGTHALALCLGGLGLLSMYFVSSPGGQYLSMIGVGIAWASILAMPYAILSSSIPPQRMGVYMGIFNFFIVIPEIIASFTFGPIIRRIFGENSTSAPLYVVMAGGAFMIIAAALCFFIVNDPGFTAVPVPVENDPPPHLPQNVQPAPAAAVVE
jgi:maltose/moltooligosaccharide transporter